jgi:toxin-antitoxin system PIN domain toxin
VEAVDVNVLVYAHRADAPDHDRYRAWLEAWLASSAPVGVADRVLTAVVRVATHPRIFDPPSTLEQALSFIADVADSPNRRALRPGRRHRTIFAELCRRSGARGSLVTDAELAALAIEHGCEWLTTDRDFARFPGLRWRHPLEG